MKGNRYCILNSKCIKATIALLLLILPSIINCQEKTSAISRDPFLLFYLSNYPTLQIDTSENVVVQRIDYKNFDKKEINFGDGDPGIFWNSIYVFKDGIFNGKDNAATNYDGILLSRYKGIEIHRNDDGSAGSIDEYSPRSDRLSWRHVYKKTNNITVANNGLRRGSVCAVLVEEESKFSYFDNYKKYNNTPDAPDTTIEFINGDVVISAYNYPPQKEYSRFYFINGILMKREYINNRTETYTVSSGKGEIIVTDTSGAVIERRTLERRINAAGYLEYEAVKYPSGAGYEYFFTKDTFNWK